MKKNSKITTSVNQEISENVVSDAEDHTSSEKQTHPEPESKATGTESSSKETNLSCDEFRLPQNYQELGSEDRDLSRIPVGRPNYQLYLRVHPSDDMVIQTVLLYYLDEQEPFLMARELWEEYWEELKPVRLYLAIDQFDSFHFIPVKLPKEDNRGSTWSVSLESTLLKMRTRWGRLISNKKQNSYEPRWPKIADSLEEPDWPNLDLSELIKTAFAERIIESKDHPILKKLDGYS